MPARYDVGKQLWRFDHQNCSFVSLAFINVSSQSLKAQVQPKHLTKSSHRYSFCYLLIVFTLPGFLFSDLSIQNRPFLSSLSVHFASISICVISMFWVISSVLYNPLPDLQTHWPLSSRGEISAAKQFHSFSRTSFFFQGLNGREALLDQVRWVNNTSVSINRKVEPTRLSRTWPHLAGPTVTGSRLNLQLGTNCGGGRTF